MIWLNSYLSHGKYTERVAKLKAVVLKNKPSIDGTTNIKIRLTHSGKSREISTPHYIDPKFMVSDGIIKSIYPNASSLNKSIYHLLIEYNRILDDIDNVDSMDIGTLLSRLRRKESRGASFIRYAGDRIKDLTKEERISYATSYSVLLIHLKGFIKREDLLFKELTFDLLEKFERYLILKKCKTNTIRIYLNNIRAIYNHASERDIFKGDSPFKKFKVKQSRPQKRAADILEIKKLMVAPYIYAQQRSVDIFMLMFCLAGINLKDLLYLKSSNVKDGYLNYRRVKLNEKQEVDLRIKIVPRAREIIEKYKGEKYLLRFLDQDDSYNKYKNFLKETNKKLRIAAVHAGCKSYFSTYVSRHSWSTIAYSLGVSKSDIDLSLGHNLNSTMTDFYIDYTKMFQRVDEANERVMGELI